MTTNKIIYNGNKEERDMKNVFESSLRELFALDQDVLYLDADLMNSFGTLALSREMPDRCVNCGIQEANMVGVAAGLSAVGKKPYVHTFGPFASRRVYDQVFLSVGYAKNSVRIIGSDPGITAAFNGGTHMPFEDVALYRAIPEAMIVDVVDSVQFRETLLATKDRPGVTYIRVPRKSHATVYGDGSKFSPGEAHVLREGSDVAIIACGIMVAEALEAAKILEEKGISAAVIDVYTIKPLDTGTIIKYATQCKAVVTAENANVIGGLGSAVCDCLAENYPVPVEKVGVEDKWGEVGPEDYLRERFALTSQNIIAKAEKAISRKL